MVCAGQQKRKMIHGKYKAGRSRVLTSLHFIPYMQNILHRSITDEKYLTELMHNHFTEAGSAAKHILQKQWHYCQMITRGNVACGIVINLITQFMRLNFCSPSKPHDNSNNRPHNREVWEIIIIIDSHQNCGVIITVITN